MPDPTVSVVIAVLDGAAFIDDAIQSVRWQTFDDWELLVVDDGSSDATAEIVSRYTLEDPRIHLLQHPDRQNHGLGASRNLGLAAARGRYIAFLDADDIYLPYKLEQHVAILARHPEVAMVYGKFLYSRTFDLPDDASEDGTSPLGLAAWRTYDPPLLLTHILRHEEFHPGVCSLLVRRSACESVGGFDEDVRMYEDSLFLARILHDFSVYVSGDCTSVYRRHPQSMCQKAEDAGFYDSNGPSPGERVFLERLEAFLQGRGDRDERVLAALTHRLDAYRDPGRYARRLALRSALDRARHIARLLGLARATRALRQGVQPRR